MAESLLFFSGMADYFYLWFKSQATYKFLTYKTKLAIHDIIHPYTDGLF